MERSISSEFARLGAHEGFTLLETRCKTTLCVTKIRWPSYATLAQRGSASLTLTETARHCRTLVDQPDPGDRDGADDQTIMHDCTPARSGEAE
jgi:hypothetical protein